MRTRRLRHLLTLLAALLLAVPLAPGTASAERAEHQSAPAFTFDGSGEVGDAHLVRTDHGIRTRVELAGIEPGVHTLWWVVWNAPEECATPYACTEVDLTDADVELAIGYGGGRAVGPAGHLQLAASLRAGEQLRGFPTEFGLPLADGLADARHAEVHLVLRSHGEPIEGLVDEMLRTFNAGCTYSGPLADSAPAYGTAGPNSCEDLYFAVFPSPNAPDAS